MNMRTDLQTQEGNTGMKKLYLGCNLKMYKGVQDTVLYLKNLEALTADIPRSGLELFIIPSYTALESASGAVCHENIMIGAQNMHWEEKGAYTGEISPLMLKELKLDLVMIGHSERRHVFRETDVEENKKVISALEHGFVALLCIGETREEKEFLLTEEVLRRQLLTGLHGVRKKDVSRLRIAYEPVWSIGESGVPASPEYAKEQHSRIKKCLCDLFGEQGLEIPVLYGGSVNRENALKLIRQPSVDGLFIGRTAWNADDFNALIREVLAVWRESRD